MPKEFKFKENEPNIEKLYRYALYKFPKHKKRLDYDEWAKFIFFKKNDNTHYFYYIKNDGNLYFSVYKKCLLEKDIKIITNFKEKIYKKLELIDIFDKILKPLQ